MNIVINVLNKPAIGGLERLVKDFSSHLDFLDIGNRVQFIVSRKYGVKFFSNSTMRKMIILLRSLSLGFKVKTNLLQNKNNSIYLIFYHAECHLIFYFLKKMFKFDERVNLILFFGQSPELYPPKISPYTVHSMKLADNCYAYSSEVAMRWKKLSNINVVYLPSCLDLERIRSIGNLSHIDEKNKIRLIHVGRPVKFKAPEESIKFSVSLAMMGYQVELHCIGIDSLPVDLDFDMPSNLKIVFYGIIPDSLRLNSQACFMLNFARFQESGEVIGVAALESLALGVPVVIESKNYTSYKVLPGILEKDQLLAKLKLNSISHVNHQNLCTISDHDLAVIHKELEPSNFVLQILHQGNGDGVFCLIQDKPMYLVSRNS